MHFAIDRNNKKRITAQNFHKKYGSKTTTGLTQTPAECPYCHSDLFLRRGTKILHFWHGTSSGYCPSKEPFGRPYMSLTPAKPNEAHAAVLRKQFKEEWRFHYKALENLIPCFSYQEFLLLLGEALTKNIFAYTEMKIEDVPYILVLALDYVPATSVKKSRGFWFRFWYKSSVQRVEDLWIRSPDSLELIRASFTPPTPPVKFPDYDSDLVADKYQPRTAFRDGGEPIIHPFIIDKVTNWFNNHPSF